MSNLSVFNFQEPRAFLLAALAERQKQDPAFSVRSWAKEMGLKGHSLLVLLLQGKRPIRLKHVEFLAPGLRLQAAERLYLQALIQLHNATTEEERRLFAVWLTELNPGGVIRFKQIDEYAVVSQWIHTAILTLAELPEFQALTDLAAVGSFVKTRFGKKVSGLEVRAALLRLEQMGLIGKDEKTGRYGPRQAMVSTRDDVPTKAVREHLRQVSELAIPAIEEQSVAEREFQAFSLAIEPGQIPLAKEMIRRFRMQLAQALHADRAGEEKRAPTEVYQMNLQFFRLTESPGAVARPMLEDEAAARNHQLNSR